jgi:hypothetical protein
VLRAIVVYRVALLVDFKKNVAPEVFKAVAPLLKKYQVEVDALTNRSKSAEGAFLDIFQKLQEAPDPSTLLGNFLVRALYAWFALAFV